MYQMSRWACKLRSYHRRRIISHRARRNIKFRFDFDDDDNLKRTHFWGMQNGLLQSRIAELVGPNLSTRPCRTRLLIHIAPLVRWGIHGSRDLSITQITRDITWRFWESSDIAMIERLSTHLPAFSWCGEDLVERFPRAENGRSLRRRFHRRHHRRCRRIRRYRRRRRYCPSNCVSAAL